MVVAPVPLAGRRSVAAAGEDADFGQVVMGRFGPRGLASIVLGLVYLEMETRLPGEETIRLTVMTTVWLSIFAHGVSALPGMSFYAEKIKTLAADAPEHQELETKFAAGN